MAKILIIDNRPVNRQFLTTLLGYQHHDLREASDGVEGLRAARDQRSDLIISDVLMPTMDGYEFVRQLRQDPDIGQTPVIFSTAHYLSSESRALAKQCGVTSIIYKPCEPQAVLDIVAAALGEQPLRLPATLRQPQEFDREHLRLVTDKVSEKADQLRESHEKLTALIELSTDLAGARSGSTPRPDLFRGPRGNRSAVDDGRIVGTKPKDDSTSESCRDPTGRLPGAAVSFVGKRSLQDRDPGGSDDLFE